jgi:glycosyl transferase family 61/methyltransferase family protein
MDYADFVAQISFDFLQPGAPPGSDGRFLVAREGGKPARLLEWPGGAVDFANTRVPPNEEQRKEALRALCDMPRMSTLALASIINRGVAEMERDDAFVNVGVWKGFSLLSAVVGNSEKTCIGVDNFSEFTGHGPRDAFMSRFEPFQSDVHRFYEMDYREYFANVHRERIGFYLYDGHHSYEEQLRGLELAEPFFGANCIVMVDDTNMEAPREATADFIDRSDYEYTVLLDETTTANYHPTWWNGVMLFQRISQTSGRASVPLRRHPGPPRGWSTSARQVGRPSDRSDGSAASVSLVVHSDQEDEECLASAVEACRQQNWPNVEVLVADERDGSASTGLSALARAVRLSTGTFLGVVDASDPPSTTMALQMALAFHDQRRSVLPFPLVPDSWMEKALLAIEEIASVVSPEETVIVVNEGLWRNEVLPRRVLPFLERDGKPWGNPSDDATAIAELKRMSRAGAGFIAFAWTGFWWLDFYSEFHDFLRSQCSCLLENERLVVFDLRSLAEAEAHTLVEEEETEAARSYRSLAEWAEARVDGSSAALYREIFPAEAITYGEPKGLEENVDAFFPLRRADVPAPAVAAVPDGYLCRNGERSHSAVLTSDRRLIWDVSNPRDRPPMSEHHWFFEATDLPTPIVLPGTVGVLTILPRHAQNYAHWMLEVLPRIDLFRRSGIPIDTFVIDTRTAPFQNETLATLGVDEGSILELDHRFHISAAELAVSYLPYPFNGPSWICAFLKKELLGDASPHAKERLYVSRGNAVRGRGIVNEGEVKDVLAEFEFREFVADRCSVAEQAEAFASADVIAGPHGAALTNLVFCRPGTKVIEFFAPSFVVPWFFHLSTRCNLDYHWLIGNGERPSSFLGWPVPKRSPDPIEIDVDALVLTLRGAGL